MNVIVQFIVRLYTRLLRLYPSSFRDVFGEEMTAVFYPSNKGSGGTGLVIVNGRCVSVAHHTSDTVGVTR